MDLVNNCIKNLKKDAINLYAEYQGKSGFKVGDTVLIARKAGKHELGWDAQWIPCMDEYIGKIGKIKAIVSNGIAVQVPDINDLPPYYFPFFVLVKRGEPESVQFNPFDQVLVRDNVNDEWTPTLFTSYNNRYDYPFDTMNGEYKYCIPYEGNEHLAGTHDD